jgi:hypothetical protein
MFDVFYSGTRPNRFAFEQPARDLDDAAAQCRTGYYWYIYGDRDYTTFNFDYCPAPWESIHTHVWPTQWQQYGGAYLAHVDSVKNRTWQFHREVVPATATDTHWHTLSTIDSFDYSWHPHPFDPPYIYVFGNQWHVPERMATVEYHVPGAVERKYVYEPQAQLAATKENWQVSVDVPLDFDFSWCPDPHDPPYTYVFGNQHWTGERSATVEYRVPGANERKYIDNVRAELGTLDIFFLDMGNPTAQARYDTLAEKYNISKIRYVDNIFDTIKRCVTKTRTARFWVISSDYDFTDFDFTWQPEPWQQHMTHVFPSQHNKWSNTFLINKWEFERHVTWAKSLEEFPNLNFVDNQSVTKTDNLYNMYYVDHGNIESRPHYNLLKKSFPDLVFTRFANTYLDTFKRIMFNAETEYVWILNSVCNYDFFDFTWQPEPWQKEMIHCFTNGLSHDKSEKRGDTFYIHIESFRAQMVELELLDWFNVINYIDGNVERWPTPAVYYPDDNIIEAIKNYTFTTPFALFTKHEEYSTITNNTCLWTEKDRTARDMSLDRSTSIIPRDIKKYLKTQIYDYPYLDTSRGRNIRFTPDIDIVYISNGEPDEERWFQHTEYQSNRDVKWIRGVDGRVAAYQAAARASTTDWFFAVFAKLEVLGGDFNWHWQPDYWQGPKHYIFNARNPVNGLEYGHMGMIAYNRSLVLANNAPGIDFTLSQPHESVPILSGIAHFNQDAWTTWRTAFREVLKLRLFMATHPTLETEHRLDVWCTRAEGNYSNYCLDGARDAVAYYEEVKGDPVQLQLSFEWKWLRERYNAKY